MSVRHNDHHWPRFLMGEQVVEDEMCAAKFAPGRIVISRSMQQIEHWEFGEALLVVLRWRINMQAARPIE